MVENPNPPIYERVSLNADDESTIEDPAAPMAPMANGDDNLASKPITASLRATGRLLRSVGGWRSNFRGITCAAAMTVAALFAAGIFSSIPFVPSFFGTLLVVLVTAPLSTAWVHIVISRPSPDPFWRRLLPMGKVFKATYIPILVAWLASTLSSYIPSFLAKLMDLPVWDPQNPGNVPMYSKNDSWKGIVTLLVSLSLFLFVVIPANVVLTRVQASLLPPEEDTIVPVDRSFGSTVEPALVGGKGYVSTLDAYKTVDRASWKRIYLLYAKILGVSVATYLLIIAIVIPEFLLLGSKSSSGQGN